MKNRINKTQTAVAIILMLTLTPLVASIQFAHSQAGYSTLPSYVFIVAAPNPVGVNQQAVVDFWLSDPVATAAVSGGDRYHGFQVTITKPDGTKESRGPFSGNDLSSAYFLYVPTQKGNYTFFVNYPGESFASFKTTYLPSNATYTLTVQQDPAPSFQNVPFSTTYWTRPANGMNDGWGAVTGNWLMAAWNTTSRLFDDGSTFVGEGSAPKSAHILWTRPIGGAEGGLVGGIMGNTPYYSGMSYEYYFKPPVILNGVLYYNTIAGQEPRTSGNMDNLGIVAVDIKTGQTLFTITNTSLSFGQIYNYVSPNQAGAYGYLWSNAGSNWRMFDAATGILILTIANVTTGLTTFGPNGEIINYNLSRNATLNQQMLTMWNSTRAIALATQPLAAGVNKTYPGQAAYAGFYGATNNEWTWRPYNAYGQTIDGNLGIQWQVPAVNKTGQSLSYLFSQGGLYKDRTMIAMMGAGSNQGFTNTSSTVGLEFIGYNMDTGATQFDNNITAAPGLPNDFNGIASFEMQWLYNGIFYQFIKQTMQWTAYDVTTGSLLWVSDPYTNPWGMYAEAGGGVAAYGNIYLAGFDGEIHAFNWTTGKTTWDFSLPPAGNINPYGVFTFYSGITVIDHNIIALTGNHGNGVEPQYQNESIVLVDTETGKLNWQMLGWFEQPAIADGVMVTHNNYDNEIYAFGKGPSATTVSTPLTGVTAGKSVMLTGTVTDQSVGAKGSPAISDTYMSDWMAYLYEQQPMPVHALGVQVKLTAIDENHQETVIGTTTSDTSGNYGLKWVPPTAGTYEIIATFEGSNSYYGSTNTAYISVDAAPTPAPSTSSTPTPTATTSPSASPSQPPAPGEQTPMSIYIALAAVAIIIVVAVAALVLRKRK